MINKETAMLDAIRDLKNADRLEEMRDGTAQDFEENLGIDSGEAFDLVDAIIAGKISHVKWVGAK